MNAVLDSLAIWDNFLINFRGAESIPGGAFCPLPLKNS